MSTVVTECEYTVKINSTDKLRQNTIIKYFFLSIVFLTSVCALLDANQSVHRGFLFNSSEIQGRLPIFANVWSEILLQTLFGDKRKIQYAVCNRPVPLHKTLDGFKNNWGAKFVMFDNLKSRWWTIMFDLGFGLTLVHLVADTFSILWIQQHVSVELKRRQTFHITNRYFPSSFKTVKHVVEDLLLVFHEMKGIITENNIEGPQASLWQDWSTPLNKREILDLLVRLSGQLNSFVVRIDTDNFSLGSYQLSEVCRQLSCTAA